MNHPIPLPVLPTQTHLRVLPSTLPSVFDYVDYHAFLRDWVAARKVCWPAYSLQLLANRAKIKSRSFLRLVCLGERSLGKEVAGDVALAMGLDPDSRRRFLELVEEGKVGGLGWQAHGTAKPSRTLRIGTGRPVRATRGANHPAGRDPGGESAEIRLACRVPGSLGSDELRELSRRLREFQAQTEAWLGTRILTSPPVPAEDPISR